MAPFICSGDLIGIASGGLNPFDVDSSWKSDPRNMGQVSTPEPLAMLMAHWVMSNRPATVLDPGVGSGGLLSACYSIDSRVALLGIDKDPELLDRTLSSAPTGTKLVLNDYLKTTIGCVDGVIANPPYIKAQRLTYTEDDWFSFEQMFGTHLDRLTNLYALFLLKIWVDLAPNGRAAILIPFEFLNANFGVPIKKHLLECIRPRAIVIIDPSINVFADATTTSTLILLEKNTHNTPIWFKLARSLPDIDDFLGDLLTEKPLAPGKGLLDLSHVPPGIKWLNLLLNGADGKEPLPFGKFIGDYFTVRRGIATGANDFFCLSPGDMLRHRLDISNVTACITKASDANGFVFTPDKFSSLVEQDRKCFLLSPTTDLVHVAHYLNIGQERGIDQRHLPSHRPVWYLPEKRQSSDILVSVFSREAGKFILNTSFAKNLTCFHGLYAKEGNQHLAPLMTLFLNSSLSRESFLCVNRFYGNGLNKLEPKDVTDMPCPIFPPQNQEQAGVVTGRLLYFESLPPDERQLEIDQLAGKLLCIDC